uniref:variable large family protein n=1 Tax=Borreliella bavariensis TaxID=664662 RepID=UPI001BFFEF39
GMKKDDQIAAAIVLRGMAKDGKFGLQNADDANGKGGVKNAVESAVKLLEKLITAGKEVVKVDFGNDSIGNVVAQGNGGAADGNSVKGIAKGIKGIVDAAGGKLDAVTAANTETNVDAGKLFGNNGGAADAGDASKAAAAVSGVSGEQILKQIVDAAGKEDGDQNGVKAADAANPIAAAIGAAEAGAFAKDGMTKDDQIAAAIVLRGMAKGGKFGLQNANDDANGKGGVKNAVESAVKLLEKLITAGKEVEKVDFGNDSIGNVVAQGQAGAADKDSVNGIAKGIKGIVDAAGGKLDAVTAANTETNGDAGKLFGNNGGAADAEAASKAATAVSGVSGEQILKQIVDAAG